MVERGQKMKISKFWILQRFSNPQSYILADIGVSTTRRKRYENGDFPEIAFKVEILHANPKLKKEV